MPPPSPPSAESENHISSCADFGEQVSTTGTLYWRAVTGDAIAETDLTGSTTNSAYKEYIFFAGRRVAWRASSGNVYFYYADALGSTNVITTGNGTPCYQATFTPYGEEHATQNTCTQNYKFTGYERDPETGLDYAFFRYYNARLGRFMSPDPLSGAVSNPQTLNRYAYVGNNPVNITDPLGLICAVHLPCPQFWGDPNDPWLSWGNGAGWIGQPFFTLLTVTDFSCGEGCFGWSVTSDSYLYGLNPSGGGGGAAQQCTLNVSVVNTAGVNPDAVSAIEGRIAALFGNTSSPVAVNYSSAGAPDATLNVTNEGWFVSLTQGPVMGYNVGSYAAIYPSNFPAYGSDMSMGNVGAHELLHAFLGLGDASYNAGNPNIMMFDLAPYDVQTAALLNPTSSFWNLTGGQAAALLAKCLTRHPSGT